MATLVTHNPWGGIFRSFDQGLLNAAGMDIVVELRDPVIANAPAVDQRSIPDRDHYEECGEAGVESATGAVGKRQSALAVVNFLRAKYGEAGVQHGTDMWELCAFLDSVHIAYDAREVPVGDGFAAALGRNHVALGAMWTEYASTGELVPVRGGHIGHWDDGGRLRAQVAPFVAPPPLFYPEDTMQQRVGQVQMAGGKGWFKLPDDAPAVKVVSVNVFDQAPDATGRYVPVPGYAGKAADRNELVFGNGPDGATPDGVYGFDYWLAAA